MIEVVIAIISSCAMIILNHHYKCECFGKSCCDIQDTENSTLTERLIEEQYSKLITPVGSINSLCTLNSN